MIKSANATVPGYCHGTMQPWNPHYVTCVKAGWNEPTSTAVNAGHAATSSVGVILAYVLIALVLIAVVKMLRRRSPAPARS